MMTDDRLASALNRIDAALSRIEQCAANPSRQDGSDEELAKRHRRLREEVGSSLSELDSLIESLER